jgi:hypothetical protein
VAIVGFVCVTVTQYTLSARDNKLIIKIVIFIQLWVNSFIDLLFCKFSPDYLDVFSGLTSGTRAM